MSHLEIRIRLRFRLRLQKVLIAANTDFGKGLLLTLNPQAHEAGGGGGGLSRVGVRQQVQVSALFLSEGVNEPVTDMQINSTRLDRSGVEKAPCLAAVFTLNHPSLDYNRLRCVILCLAHPWWRRHSPISCPMLRRRSLCLTYLQPCSVILVCFSFVFTSFWRNLFYQAGISAAQN